LHRISGVMSSLLRAIIDGVSDAKILTHLQSCLYRCAEIMHNET